MSFATEFRQARVDQQQSRLAGGVLLGVSCCMIAGLVGMAVLVQQYFATGAPVVAAAETSKVQVRSQPQREMTRYEKCMWAKGIQVSVQNASVSHLRVFGMVPDGWSEAMAQGTKAECDRFREQD